VGGAIYGAAYAITSIIAGKALDRPSVERVIDNTSEGKTLKWAIAAFAGLAVAWAAMAAAGFPITFVATLGLNLAAIPATFIIGCIVCCFHLSDAIRTPQQQQVGHRQQMDNIRQNFQAAFEGQGHVLGST
ncbi:MAG TPA: hypothetical protein VLG76_03545, partial [Rhabdochlamydiaceae bacterium]|nr:hypothetical protein [Rhabdochlamydiaceae bacterium]